MYRELLIEYLENDNNSFDNYINIYKDLFNNTVFNPQLFIELFVISEEFDYNVENKPKLISEDDVNKVGNVYLDYVYGLIEMMTKNNIPEMEFYSKLYEKVFDSDIIPNDYTVKGIILCFIAKKSQMLPYYEAVNLVRMTNEEYREILNKHLDLIGKAERILKRPFASRTEEASQIVEIVSSIGDVNEKAALAAVIMQMLREPEREE